MYKLTHQWFGQVSLGSLHLLLQNRDGQFDVEDGILIMIMVY